MRLHRLSLLLLSLAACAGPASRGPAPEVATFCLALMNDATGGAAGLSEREVFEAHRRFLEEEASSGRVLATGSFSARSGGARGAMLLDLPDPGDAQRSVLQRDPAVEAGLLSAEVCSMVSLTVLRRLPALEQARVERGEVAGASRRFLLVLAADGAAALELVQHPAIAPSVLLLGRLGAPREGGLAALLDLERARELDVRLRIAGAAPPGWEVHEWFTTPAFGALAGEALQGPHGQGPDGQPPSSSESK